MNKIAIFIYISKYNKKSSFLVKKPDVSRNHEVCQVEYSLGDVWLYQVSSLWEVCNRFSVDGGKVAF